MKANQKTVHIKNSSNRTLFLLCLWLIAAHMTAQAILTDKNNGQPIPYAQITDKNGVTIGTTDENGMFPENLAPGKATIQHLAYDPKEIECGGLTADTVITLTPRFYTLGEVNVSADGMDYIHMRTYFRSYQLNDSCMKYYKDGFADFFIDIKKKKSKRFVSQLRNFENKRLTDKDRKRANTMTDKFTAMPYLEKHTLMEKLKREGMTFSSDTPVGGIWHDGTMAGTVSTDTVSGISCVTYNALENKKEKTGTLFGYTTRLVSHLLSETYHYRKGAQPYSSLINRKGYRKIFYKHKKDSVWQTIEVTDELYVLKNECVSSEKMKEITAALESPKSEAAPDSSLVQPLNRPLAMTLETEMTQTGR